MCLSLSHLDGECITHTAWQCTGTCIPLYMSAISLYMCAWVNKSIHPQQDPSTKWINGQEMGLGQVRYAISWYLTGVDLTMKKCQLHPITTEWMVINYSQGQKSGVLIPEKALKRPRLCRLCRARWRALESAVSRSHVGEVTTCNDLKTFHYTHIYIYIHNII